MSELREMAERWFVKAHKLEDDRCFPAGFERRMCANELLAALDKPEVPGPDDCGFDAHITLRRFFPSAKFCPDCGRKIEVEK